jgi:hypothetical protein
MITNEINHLWIMDPIDGTANLVKQQEDYCIISFHYFFLPLIVGVPENVLLKIVEIVVESVYLHL